MVHDRLGKNWFTYPCRSLAGDRSLVSSGASRGRCPEEDQQRCRPRDDQEDSWRALEEKRRNLRERDTARLQIRCSFRLEAERESDRREWRGAFKEEVGR